MSKYQRQARIESVGADGVFEMTLATEGEASDGHILSIKGGQIPERMPLLTSHWNDPEATLGSITNPQKALKDSPPRLRATGQIEMDGPKSDVRRDLAHMIAKGHVTGVSIRWDEIPGKSVRRVNLPSDHPYFVDAEEAQGPERYGFFFEEWIGREGSIVALPADKNAVVGRAEETEGEVREFWRAMAQDDEDHKEASKAVATLAALRADAVACLEAGATPADLINAVTQDFELGEEFESCRIGDTTILLPRSVADQLEDEREDRELDPIKFGLEPEPDQEPEPEPDQAPVIEEERVESADPLSAAKPLESLKHHLAETNPLLQAKLLRLARKKGISPLDVLRNLKDGLDADRKEVFARFYREVEKQRGKVSTI
jgi:hypothetical protein